MEPNQDKDRDDQQPDTPHKAEFHIEKLEERIAPAPSPLVSVTPSGNFHVRPPVH
jgi:hypothetical protein